MTRLSDIGDYRPMRAPMVSDREFDELHVEALEEGAEAVRITLSKFRVAASRHQWAEATALLAKAREQIETFDVKDSAIDAYESRVAA